MKNLMMLIGVSAVIAGANCDSYSFEEQGGLLVIETENLDYQDDWIWVDTIADYTGSGYIQWEGVQNYNTVQNGIIDFNIKINTPGTYTFLHHVAIADLSEGTTEHNDSWLKIEADDFYATRDSNQVTPRPQCEADALRDCPEGRSDQGYFKMYGGNSTWKWTGNTFDGSAHQVYARFDQAGVYPMSIAARSSYQANDRMVLFHENVTRAEATDLSQPETPCQSTSSLLTQESKHQIQMTHHNIHNPLELEIVISDLQGRTVLISQQPIVSLESYPQGVYLINTPNEQFRMIR